MVNNGVVHVLRALANHWEGLNQIPFGNFAHQRMEQLNVNVILRFHMPFVLMTLANLRGWCSWDSMVLGPFITKLMNLRPTDTMDPANELLNELNSNIVDNVCGGIFSRIEPFQRLITQMRVANELIMTEKEKVVTIVSSVTSGIESGYKLAKTVDWVVPDDDVMVRSIIQHIKLDAVKKKLRNYNGERLIDEENGTLDANQAGSALQDMDQEEIGPAMKIAGGSVSSIVPFVQKDLSKRQKTGMTDHLVKRAMNALRPRDKRFLIELVNKGHEEIRAAKLLSRRVGTLLKREIRRARLDARIKELSRGSVATEMIEDEWYIVDRTEDDGSTTELGSFQFRTRRSSTSDVLFINRSGKEDRFDANSHVFRKFIPIGEAIVRAQKAFMVIELDLLKRFAYAAYMEFSDLRDELLKLQTVSGINCYALDEARLNGLVHIKSHSSTQISWKDLQPGHNYFIEVKPYKYELFEYAEGMDLDNRKRYFKTAPQNMIVVGGGPTGLLTTLHCLENCLKTGGTMKLYEARDAFEKAGGTYERAQVVRLDSRWVRMLRFHLGTSYEDVWIPATEETDSHLGNTLPTQGFIEITIKDMEAIMHLEVSKLWSRDLLEIYARSSANFDYKKNVMTKLGNALKEKDLVKRRVDPNGEPSEEFHTWEVIQLISHETLSAGDLTLGGTYNVYIRQQGLIAMRLVSIDLHGGLYALQNKELGITVKVPKTNLPTIYEHDPNAKGGAHSTFKTIVFQSTELNSQGKLTRYEVDFKTIANETHVMDVGQTNIAFALGKPATTKEHLTCCPYEPYGVSCIQGIKISMGMHNFGETRFGKGLINDFRSQTEQNTRVVGDFTKSVITAPIIKEMLSIMSNLPRSNDWHMHLRHTVDKFPEQKELIDSNVGERIRESLVPLAKEAKTWFRNRLQTRFFETGDNYYLGMEFPREYEVWKYAVVDKIVGSAPNAGRLKGTLRAQCDRLWFEACIAVITRGDVYNPSGKFYVPRIWFISSHTDVKLGALPEGEAFRIVSDKKEKYEVLVPGRTKVVVRSIEGIVSALSGETIVHRESDLTRQPDGNTESFVSCTTFPVTHYVNYRAVNVLPSKYWCSFSIGDGQSSPHFMRYSGLTGAAINAMLINNYLGSSIRLENILSRKRVFQMSHETNWSNDEVVKRGTGYNYGVDGFLRPGAAYDNVIEYLYYKMLEMDVARYEENYEDDTLSAIFMLSWQKKFAAMLIPRGMETNDSHTRALEIFLGPKILKTVLNEMMTREELKEDENEAFMTLFQQYASDGPEAVLGEKTMFESDGTLFSGFQEEWDHDLKLLFEKSQASEETQDIVMEYMDRAYRITELLNRCFKLARDEHIDGKRFSSEAENEPKSTDSFFSDFPVEAQSFASGLELSSIFGAISLSATQGSVTGGSVVVSVAIAITFAILNIPTSFGTMTNVSRYVNRQEEFRAEFSRTKMLGLERTLFKVLSSSKRKEIDDASNPLLKQVRVAYEDFVTGATYYDTSSDEIQESYGNTNFMDLKSVEAFMEEITSNFIAKLYQKEAYLKDKLVSLYAACIELAEVLENDERTGDEETYIEDEATYKAFRRMPNFTERLENSLQTGPIVYGFIRKNKKVGQWAIFAPIRTFYFMLGNFLLKGLNLRCGVLNPISTEIKVMRGVVTALNRSLGQTLKKEAYDLKELFHATMESSIGMSLFFVGMWVFIFSFFIIANGIASAVQNTSTTCAGALGISGRNSFQQYQCFVVEGGAIVSALAGLIALSFFVRQFRHQRKVVAAINYLPSPPPSVRKIGSLAYFQSLISIWQCIATCTSLASIVIGFVLRFDFADFENNVTFGLAIGAVGAFGISIFLQLIANLGMLYNVEPSAGIDVCSAFWGTLTKKHRLFSLGRSEKSVMSPALEDRESWEYVAREFLTETRFDTVLGADRFNAVMQAIQSGDTSSWRGTTLVMK
uniref:Uncharacterized protein n=1 Tax=Ditylum brightwellii TaxID=49249 RepID=A0A7S2ETP3_9STRA